MKEFVDNLNHVNALAENHKGFVWRLKDETNSAVNLNPYHDEKVVINLSVWESVEALKQFTYETYHASFIKRRREWFADYGQVHHAMWWIKAGVYPSFEKAIARLKFLQKKGPSQKAFDFKNLFSPPQD